MDKNTQLKLIGMYHQLLQDTFTDFVLGQIAVIRDLLRDDEIYMPSPSELNCYGCAFIEE